jgi:hypothetical protein
MSKFYNKLENDFTQIPNIILQDVRISALAFKIYCYICFRIGRNTEWEFYNNEILKYCKEGKHSLMKAKKELIEYGYLEKVKQNHKENGDFGGCDYIIYKEPINLARSEIASTLLASSKIASTLEHVTNNKDIEINKESKKNEINKQKYKKENLNELIENNLKFAEEDKEKINKKESNEKTEVESIYKNIREFYKNYNITKRIEPEATKKHILQLLLNGETMENILNGMRLYTEQQKEFSKAPHRVLRDSLFKNAIEVHKEEENAQNSLNIINAKELLESLNIQVAKNEKDYSVYEKIELLFNNRDKKLPKEAIKWYKEKHSLSELTIEEVVKNEQIFFILYIAFLEHLNKICNLSGKTKQEKDSKFKDFIARHLKDNFISVLYTLENIDYTKKDKYSSYVLYFTAILNEKIESLKTYNKEIKFLLNV